jgi:hypothetical protein
MDTINKERSVENVKPKFAAAFSVYRQKVEGVTKETIKEIIKKGEVPSRCEYTGIEFADVRGKANPNDWYKRSVDHKISILKCFLTNIEPGIAGGRSNISFGLKYVNNIKGNMDSDYFIKTYCKDLISTLNEN